MGVTKMGFEGLVYQGVAGSTGATPVTNIRDVTHTIDPKKAPTTVKGDEVPALETEQVVTIATSMEWTMLDKTTDTTLTAFRVAAAAGTPVALRLKDHTAGKGFDGDVTLSEERGQPYQGEQTFKFTATPTDESGRAPQLYV